MLCRVPRPVAGILSSPPSAPLSSPFLRAQATVVDRKIDRVTVGVFLLQLLLVVILGFTGAGLARSDFTRKAW